MAHSDISKDNLRPTIALHCSPGRKQAVDGDPVSTPTILEKKLLLLTFYKNFVPYEFKINYDFKNKFC